MKFPPTLNELLVEFADLPDWDERYDYLIDLGRQLPRIPDELTTDENLVRGCMSTVWLVSDYTETPHRRMHFRADSDSLIIKGLLVVLLALFDDRSPEEIVTTDETQTLRQFGLDQHLSPQRRNGLFAMVKRIKQLAMEHVKT
ncbi:MAG: SufE family protein [Pirellulaceae bacterium]|jgi:cysteine desulfuration protein SufE|nr:SufE family protein [Pirellulaceae bacterium]